MNVLPNDGCDFFKSIARRFQLVWVRFILFLQILPANVSVSLIEDCFDEKEKFISKDQVYTRTPNIFLVFPEQLNEMQSVISQCIIKGSLTTYIKTLPCIRFKQTMSFESTSRVNTYAIKLERQNIAVRLACTFCDCVYC